MVWIYLSPHLDDAVLSCGGLIWQQTRAGEQVHVWTICSGEPPPGQLSMFAQVLHKRWGLADQHVVTERRKEDLQALSILGAEAKHFSVPDAVYRRHPKTNQVLYNNWEDVLNGLAPGDERVIDRLVIDLANSIPAEANLVAPLTLGNHIDHLITRATAERLRRPIRYYLDYPYASEYAAEIPSLLPAGFRQRVYPVPKKALSTWQQAIMAYSSQISSFWTSEKQMRTALKQYRDQLGGVVISESDP
ncbi:MAG: PIG-L family deacetylase [Chloroflexota bacterium]